MNLAWHLFRKDLRQFRILLAAWAGLLLLNLAVNLGWAGQVGYTSAHGFERASNTWANMLPAVLWIMVAILPSMVVITDSPARREGFLATRPLPKRDLFLAKLLFALVIIVAPWTLQELVHLAIRGMPIWVIAGGTFERFVAALPLAVGFGAFAALWAGYARWARAVAISIVCLYASGLALELVQAYFLHREVFLADQNYSQEIAASLAVMCALVILSGWHSRAHRGAPARWGGLALAGVVYCLAAAYWPWDLFALQPENQADASSDMAATGFEIPTHALQVYKVQQPNRDRQPTFNISLTPKTESSPTGCVIEWVPTGAKLTHAGGGTVSSDRVRAKEIFGQNYWNASFDVPDFEAWAPAFPSDVLYRQDHFFGGNQSASVQYTGFPLPTDSRELGAPLNLSASFEARVFQWRKIADLPLTPGASSTDQFGGWKLTAVKAGQPFPQFFLERHDVELATARDSRCSSVDGGPTSRMAFMIYDPLRHMAWLPQQTPAYEATRGSETALVFYYDILTLNSMPVLSPEVQARARLVIFEKSWTGSVPETWQSPDFTLDDKIEPVIYGMGGNNQPMPRTEFNRRVAALKLPAPDAPRREVSLYLLEFFRLVDAQAHPLPLNDPDVRQVAAFIPAHLDLFLDALPVMSGASKTCAMDAIRLGATDAQKPAIIAALPRDPGLAGVLLDRGWVENGRAEIYQLVKSSHTLPIEALRAIAWFHDPGTYPRLLEEFEANPTVEKDELLGTLSGLDARLDAIVSREWHTHSLVLRQNGWDMFGGAFELALRHGQLTALQRTYLMLDDPDFEKLNLKYYLRGSLAEGVQMPDLKPEQRQDSQLVLGWMRKHRPGDFVFNPALRQFILAPGIVQTASNP